MEQNYRSTANILNAANAVISHIYGRKGQGRRWTMTMKMVTRLHFGWFDTAFDEAEYIVSDIKRTCGKGRVRLLRDNAILYRTNAQSRMFEEKFVTANIPYKIIGGINFYARRGIEDILADI
ncbi:MAG: 3'-5' exonuclease [Dorea sp.]